MMCQSSVVEVVGTFKICKIATLVKIRLRSQPVTSAAVHDADIIVHVYFLLGWEPDGIFHVVLYYDAGNVLTSVCSVDF